VIDRPRFRIALTHDFYLDDGRCRYENIGLEIVQKYDHIDITPLDNYKSPIGSDQLCDIQGVIVMAPAVTTQSLNASDNLLAVGRFGVGFDQVDIEACTAADVVALNTSGAVDRSVAEATVTWMLALTHHVRSKDALVREGKWDERIHHMGTELRDRTLGVVGLGGIGSALVRLLDGFGMNSPIVCDPYCEPERAVKLGVKLVDLDELLSEADFVSLNCPLNDETTGMIGARQLQLMKPTAYLINTARGAIVDEDALYETLQTGGIAGAGIDCFPDEPLTQPHRFRQFENVLLAPHSIAWTWELFSTIGRTAFQSMIDLSLHNEPHGVLNRDVFQRPGFQQKWARLCL